MWAMALLSRLTVSGVCCLSMLALTGLLKEVLSFWARCVLNWALAGDSSYSSASWAGDLVGEVAS